MDVLEWADSYAYRRVYICIKLCLLVVFSLSYIGQLSFGNISIIL